MVSLFSYPDADGVQIAAKHGDYYFVSSSVGLADVQGAIVDLQCEFEYEMFRLSSVCRGSDKFERQRINVQKRFFAQYDRLLHQQSQNILCHKLVAQALHANVLQYHGEEYDAVCLTVMPNHIHWVFRYRATKHLLPNLLRRARYCFAQITHQHHYSDYYLHRISDYNELERVLHYMVHDPVREKLATEWSEWPYTYVYDIE